MNLARLVAGTVGAGALIVWNAAAHAQQPPASSQPSPGTTQVASSGRTLASSRLATDILNRIAGHVRTVKGCQTLSEVRMEVMPRGYVPVQPAVSANSRGGHFERWSVNACGERQLFQIGMWPAQRGGSDFAVTPLALASAPSGAGAAAARPVSSTAPSSAWHGRYVWEESVGRIGGSAPSEGVAAFIEHTLVLGPSAGATSCALNGDGYQTHRRIICTATPEGQSLAIKFYKFAPGNALGRHQVGERLFTLTRGPEGLTTRLEGLGRAVDNMPRSGVLFRSTR